MMPPSTHTKGTGLARDVREAETKGERCHRVCRQKAGVSSARCPRSWGCLIRLETEVREWPQFWWWEDLPHAFHTPDKHLIVGPREAGSGLLCISNNNNDADDDTSHLLSARHLATCVASLVSPVLTAASLEGGSQQIRRPRGNEIG